VLEKDIGLEVRKCLSYGLAAFNVYLEKPKVHIHRVDCLVNRSNFDGMTRIVMVRPVAKLLMSIDLVTMSPMNRAEERYMVQLAERCFSAEWVDVRLPVVGSAGP
jgi:hypothetical protein